jgi:dolichol-phosphate mannosyltransferase
MRHATLEDNLREMERTREQYWRRYPATSPTKLEWRALTVRHAFHVLPGERVLELGAGTGLWTEHLTEALRGECPITAVVFDERFANELSARELPNVEVAHVRERLEDLPAESFDYVVGTAIICHDRYRENLRVLHRLLKPGGQLLFFEANFWNPQVLVKSVVKPVGRWAGNAECQIGMRRWKLVQEASRSGYVELEVIPYDILHPRAPASLIPAIQSTAYLLERMPAVRDLCGTLYVWARKPGVRQSRLPNVNLATHEELRGSTSVVIPCHNEASTVGQLVTALLDAYGDYLHEIIVVDDSSTDETAAVARGLAEKDPRVRLIQRTANPGVGGALRAGYDAATGRYVLSLDCDFVLIVPELRDLFDAVAEGRDGAIGSRFSHQSILVNYPLPKILANRAFHLLLRPFLGRRVRDVSNNLKLYRQDVVRELDITEAGFAANAEIGIQPLLARRDIEEVPMSWVDRAPDMGTSAFNIARAGPGYVRVLARLARGKAAR